MAKSTATHRSAAITTVGHGSRSASELIAVLRAAGVARVIDVRSYPASRRWPWFGREALERALAESGVGYAWMGRALGGKRRARADDRARHPALAPGLAAFARHMEGARFAGACDGLAARADDERLALLCAERDPRQCHRWLIADYLVLVAGVAVRHWLAPGRAGAHCPSAAARLADDGRLRYDLGCTGALLDTD
ncbi:MAG: DUF488 domain-containing protein [Halofilum sp. (in: g-proteobacteria)]|nr:DUF488 domain-containing protein [Halofilum sp. (in: g-proteobacteria)]